jgi:riboflavin biosynthesis pyrimidine reductase
MDEVANVERLAGELYGATAQLPVRGVLHVVSAFEHADGRLHVIKIGPQAPKSSSDFFVLNYWRAHADAILTTAAVVRAEPKLSHEIQGEHRAGLAIYRAQRLNKRELPLCAILTARGELPSDHRIWQDRARNHVLTSPERAPALHAQLGSRAAVVGIEQLTVARAIDWLSAQGAQCVLIEAGPSTAGQLYTSGRGVDHLMLSRCEAEVPPAAVGGALADPGQLFAGLTRRSQTERREESGRWRFERWDRASG